MISGLELRHQNSNIVWYCTLVFSIVDLESNNFSSYVSHPVSRDSMHELELGNNWCGLVVLSNC